jgi:ribosomal protein S8
MNLNSRNLLLTIKNISQAKNIGFFFKNSVNNLILLEKLYIEGYIQSYTFLKNSTYIYIFVRYFENKSVFQYLKFFLVSGQANNISSIQLSRLINKRFTLFLSSNKNLITAFEARQHNIGGKLLFLI